jgi:hypothetical protein
VRYDNGYSSYLEVLDAERQLFGAEMQAATALAARLNSIVDVCMALGGGWDDGKSPEDAAPAQTEGDVPKDAAPEKADGDVSKDAAPEQADGDARPTGKSGRKRKK